ncbi:MAG: LpxD N-terminal domain-containing protein [Pyrinomonadaceae bacterium]
MPQRNPGRTVAELAALVGGRLIGGNDEALITSVASLASAGAGEIAFVEDAKALRSARDSSKASCLIVPEESQVAGRCAIAVARPKLAFALIAEELHPRKKMREQIHSTAIVAESAQLDAPVFVGPYAQSASARASERIHRFTPGLSRR